MRTDIPTIASYLKKLDYESHIVGKWHLGHSRQQLLPTSRGFDTFYGFFEGGVSVCVYISMYVGISGCMDGWKYIRMYAYMQVGKQLSNLHSIKPYMYTAMYVYVCL